MGTLKILTYLSQMSSGGLKEVVHVLCLVHNKCSIIAHCDMRYKRIIKEKMIHSVKEHVIEKVMLEYEFEGSIGVCLLGVK